MFHIFYFLAYTCHYFFIIYPSGAFDYRIYGDVQHTHVHIVPMHDYHDITSKSMLEGKRSNPSDEELKKITEGLKELISAVS